MEFDAQSKKVPKIFFGTHTHSQIKQIIKGKSTFHVIIEQN